MKKYLGLISFLFLYLDIYGQGPILVFSPEASGLSKYGQFPANDFNGLPEITIPLTTFKAKRYEFPVYLSYHASVTYPDSHPGRIGLNTRWWSSQSDCEWTLRMKSRRMPLNSHLYNILTMHL